MKREINNYGSWQYEVKSKKEKEKKEKPNTMQNELTGYCSSLVRARLRKVTFLHTPTKIVTKEIIHGFQ